MKPHHWRKGLLVVLPVWLRCEHNLTAEEFRTLHAWLTCDECVNGERAAVAALGPKVVALLDSALIGPSRGRRDLMKAKAQDGARIARTTGQRTVEYVDARLANYVATYQKRAAVSLGDIGDERAKSALDRAIAQSAPRSYRPDVLRVIEFVRSTSGVPRFGGTIKPSRFAYGDVVTLVAPAGRHFTATTRAGLKDSPFPQNQVPFRRVTDTVQFLALADLGYHAITLRNVATAGDTATTPLLINSIRDQNDRAMVTCADTDPICVTARAPSILPGHTQPFLTFLAFQRVRNPPDTLDFFKVEPVGTSSLTVTAELDWHGPANLDLVWLRCSTKLPIGNTDGATSANPEITSVTIPAGQCWLLQVSMVAGGGSGPAFARLQLRTP